MIAVLDHVTQFVRDRDETAARYRALGFNATPGGLHPRVGSANHLCYFGLFYVEMLSIHDMDEAINGPSAVCRNAVRFIAEGEGFGGIALETEDLAAAEAGLRAAGAEPGEVVHMERVQKDGFASVSRILYPVHPGGAVPLPIVIERNIGPAEREPMLEGRGVIAPHPLGAISVDSLAVAVADLDAAAQVLCSAFGYPAGPAYVDPVFDADCVRLAAGRGDIVLCCPRGSGPAGTRLERRGAGVFAMICRAADPAAVRARLDADADGLVAPGQLHGAMLRII